MIANRSGFARRTALALGLTAAIAGPRPSGAIDWFDGSVSMQAHICVLPLYTGFEQLAWSWVGFSSPAVVGDVYWMHIVVGSLGCSGIYAVPEVRLPPNTSFAIDAAHPITCIYKDTAGVYHPFTGGECPSSPGASLYPYLSGFRNLGNTNGYLWGLAGGSSLEIRFPVRSTSTLSGMATNDYLMGAVQISDVNTGNIFWDGPSGPYTGGLPAGGPYEGVFVFAAGAAAKPTIRYVEPTLVSVTSTSAVTAAEVTSAGCSASVYYEIYPADGSTDTTFQDMGTSSCAWSSSAPFQCAIGWGGLIGGKTYKWRVFDWAPAAGQPASCAKSNVIGLPASATDGWHYFAAPTGAAPTFYSLVTTGSGGTVALSPTATGGAYAPGTSVQATATPTAGYTFAGWTLDGSDAGTANPLGVTMNASRALAARFTAPAGGGGGGGGGGGCSTGGGVSTALLLLATLPLLARRRRG